MSLINKLLQDLEQRQAADAKSVAIPAGVQSVFRPRRRAGWLLPAMLLLPVVAAAGLWAVMSNGGVPAAPVAKAPAKPAAAPAVVMAKVDVPKAPEPVVAKAPVEAPAEPPKAAVPKPAEKITAPKPAEKVAAPKPAEPVVPPKSSVVAAATTSKAVVAQDAPKIAGLYPGILKKPVNAAPAVAAVQPVPAAAAEAPMAKLTVPPEAKSQKTFTPRQQSDNLYKQAVQHAQQGQGKEARELLAKSLEAAPQNAAARQLLVGLLVEANRLPDALNLLREGVKVSPDQSGLWMNLARLQLEYGDATGATVTLEQGLSSASNDPAYNAFYAALLQRAGRHEAALKHYLAALESDPSMPNWLVGAGISMQAMGRDADAAEAFQRAKDGGQLPPAFTAFVDQRLTQLKR